MKKDDVFLGIFYGIIALVIFLIKYLIRWVSRLAGGSHPTTGNNLTQRSSPAAKESYDLDDEVDMPEEFQELGSPVRGITKYPAARKYRGEFMCVIAAEKDNPHDANAIVVAIHIKDKDFEPIGYLSRGNKALHRAITKEGGYRLCRGFIGAFFNEDDELLPFARVIVEG